MLTIKVGFVILRQKSIICNISRKDKEMANSDDKEKKLTKIVLCWSAEIDSCYFSLSKEAISYLVKQPEIQPLLDELRKDENFKECFDEQGNIKNDDLTMELLDLSFSSDIARDNPALIRCVEKLGDRAGTEDTYLEIVQIKGNKYEIKDNDCFEYVETPDGRVDPIYDGILNKKKVNTRKLDNRKNLTEKNGNTNPNNVKRRKNMSPSEKIMPYNKTRLEEEIREGIERERMYYESGFDTITEQLEETERWNNEFNERTNLTLQSLTSQKKSNLDKMKWVYSKGGEPQEAMGELELENGKHVIVSCLAKNIKYGPYELMVMSENDNKIITDSVVENHHKGKKYTRQQIDRIINLLEKEKRTEKPQYSSRIRYLRNGSVLCEK